MLNYSGTYYVLIKNKDDNRIEEYETLIDSITSNESIAIYTADLSDGFNKSYLAKEANYNPESIDEFAVTGTTLVKIIDGKIDSVYDNYDAIKEKLNELM
ncbi:MAG: hypothetical protein IJ093_00270 [Bacilli bacterium]|nr:hypothetical protein [Bacilli bacterium]